MKHHTVTAMLLLLALALYFAGYAGLGTVCFIFGGVFELWFWLRLFGNTDG